MTDQERRGATLFSWSYGIKIHANKEWRQNRWQTNHKYRGQKINANFFCTKFFNNPSGHGHPRRKSRTSAPKSAFSCGSGGGEKLFDPWAFGHKGQECPREIRARKFMFMLFFLPQKYGMQTSTSMLKEPLFSEGWWSSFKLLAVKQDSESVMAIP